MRRIIAGNMSDVAVEKMIENMEYLRKARKRKDPNNFVLGGYVNTRYVSSENPAPRIRNRKNLRIVTEKLVNESMERIKEKTRKL